MFIGIAEIIFGQAKVNVEVSADTIRPGEMVTITYTIENGEGNFDAPDLSELPVISGPNVSTSVIIQNGKKNSSQAYSYILRPQQQGEIIIPEGSYMEKGNTQTIEEVRIHVISEYSAQSDVKAQEQNQSSKLLREKKKF